MALVFPLSQIQGSLLIFTSFGTGKSNNTLYSATWRSDNGANTALSSAKEFTGSKIKAMIRYNSNFVDGRENKIFDSKFSGKNQLYHKVQLFRRLVDSLSHVRSHANGNRIKNRTN